jgi:hypothetical protein
MHAPTVVTACVLASGCASYAVQTACVSGIVYSLAVVSSTAAMPVGIENYKKNYYYYYYTGLLAACPPSCCRVAVRLSSLSSCRPSGWFALLGVGWLGVSARARGLVAPAKLHGLLVVRWLILQSTLGEDLAALLFLILVLASECTHSRETPSWLGP